MPDNLFPIEPNEGARRDILSEIDAGELDEPYLIKHSSDYGTARWDFLTTVIQMLTKLFNVRPPVVRKPIEGMRVERINNVR